MKPAFASPTAMDATVQPRYDPYYNHASSSSSPPLPSYHRHSQHSSAHPREPSPHHHYTASPYPTEKRQYPREQSHSHQHPHTQRPQQQEYAPRSHSPHRHSSMPSYYDGHSSHGSRNPDHRFESEDRRPYRSYSDPYSSEAHPQHPTVRHSEGYEGRIRNNNRDDNDHLLTTDRHANTHDQQQHHSQYRADSYGFIKHQPSSQYPSSQSEPRRALDDSFNKFHLPPIQVPEEPFYRKDLPGRHMRYFRNVTSQDLEDQHGYYSSARHVAPSNTSGNFGHGPTISDALERFTAKQAQQSQQAQPPQQEGFPSLPSLYTALPEQRPGGPSSASYSRSDSGSSERSSPPQQHRMPYQQHSPAHSPVRSHQHQGHVYHQGAGPVTSKPKPIQPRSIAPAPTAHGPMSPEVQQQAMSPRAASKRPDRQAYVKIEPKEYYQSYPQAHQRSSPPSTQPKRKWDRDHSPARQGPRPDTMMAPISPDREGMDESSQELHLLSRRSQYTHSAQKPMGTSGPLAKKTHPKTKMQRYQMTTIRCWHGAIAQKSYGIEKRYLCPPPMVHVSAGVNAKQVRAEQPHVTMSVIHEKVSGPHNENLMEQDCTLDDNLKCSFRNLHVTGTGSDSSKRFKLGLQVYLNKNSSMPTAIMDSNPIPIISKPSKKTAKAGNASCFILNGMSVSLLNRINAQTVRTKYMAVDNNAVCAKIGSWSSFTIKMVKPPPAPPVKAVANNTGPFRAPTHSTKFVPIRMKGDLSGPGVSSQGQAAPMARSLSNQGRPESGSGSNGALSSSFQFRHQQQLQQEPVYVFTNSEPVLYGSEIVLINDLTGIMTDRLIIRKVENGRVSRSGTGPVSQMQKIVLEHPDRVHPDDGRAYYLSASSIGSPKIEGKIPLQAAMDRSPLLEYRTSSKKASIMDMTDHADEEEDELNDEDGDHNGQPKRSSKGQDSVVVDDFVCWTIAGIAKFDYTYFGPIPASVDTDVDPTKVPTVLTCPNYNPQTNTMTMAVKNVFEKLTPEEETRLVRQHDDVYERRLTLSEYVHKRCEDVRQPMPDEEGPIQLWLAQHGPIRMRRRNLTEIVIEEDDRLALQQEANEAESNESDVEDQEEDGKDGPEDRLPKIATKSIAPKNGNNNSQPQINSANGRHYGGSHLPASMNPALNSKPRKLVKHPMGLEAELPYGMDLRAAHDGQGNAIAELDILMVERASGIAYRTGYKVVYSRERGERSDWTIKIVG